MSDGRLLKPPCWGLDVLRSQVDFVPARDDMPYASGRPNFHALPGFGQPHPLFLSSTCSFGMGATLTNLPLSERRKQLGKAESKLMAHLGEPRYVFVTQLNEARMELEDGDGLKTASRMSSFRRSSLTYWPCVSRCSPSACAGPPAKVSSGCRPNRTTICRQPAQSPGVPHSRGVAPSRPNVANTTNTRDFCKRRLRRLAVQSTQMWLRR